MPRQTASSTKQGNDVAGGDHQQGGGAAGAQAADEVGTAPGGGRRPAQTGRGSREFTGLFEHPGGGVVAGFGDDFEAGPVDAHVDLAELAVDEGLVAGVAQRVLVARFLGDLGVALLDAVQAAFGVERAASGCSVLARMLSYMVKGRWMRLTKPSPQRAESPTSVP